ncbi:MAG: hypothetical protein BAJATHORv1_70048 [Candidatus Thorarchaeota archaeon]|nr:MAG: hypothetical protein BAJATHORv1_70048 [Candidatus Thorarchaeota archaeon]
MDIEGIVIFGAESGIPLYSQMSEDIEPSLFSGFVSAIQNFAREMALGGLSSFVTDEKTVFLAARDKTVTALIAPVDSDFEEIYSLAYNLGEKFEEKYEVFDGGNVEIYKSFDSIVSETLKENEVPFIFRVANFAKKEIGGDVSIRPSLKTRDGDYEIIDILVDYGDKTKKGGLRDRIIQKHLRVFSTEIIFIKAIDDTAGRGEVMKFLESLKNYGIWRREEEDLDDVFPYFPSKAVVVARDYSPTVFEGVRELDKVDDKTYIAPDHLSFTLGSRRAPKTTKCFVELWKWYDNKYPERVFD